jgi:hypothetical protein
MLGRRPRKAPRPTWDMPGGIPQFQINMLGKY